MPPLEERKRPRRDIWVGDLLLLKVKRNWKNAFEARLIVSLG